MNTLARRIAYIGLLALLLSAQTVWAVSTGNIDEVYKYGWAENAGWLTMRPEHAEVDVNQAYLYAGVVGEDHLYGYVWAENIGYIRLGIDASGSGSTYDNKYYSSFFGDYFDWGVNRNGDELSGYAWSETTGWINFKPDHGGVTLAPVDGDPANGYVLQGYAWGERIGWINLDNTLLTPAHKVVKRNAAPILEPHDWTIPLYEDDLRAYPVSVWPGDVTFIDLDRPVQKDLAVTGVNNMFGLWQYSLDSGSTWLNFTDITGRFVNFEQNARLLDQYDRMRFVTPPNTFGLTSFSFRAWD